MHQLQLIFRNLIGRPGFLRCFRDPIRVPRIENRVTRNGENYHQVLRIRENRVPRIRQIGSLQVRTGYLTFSFKKNLRTSITALFERICWICWKSVFTARVQAFRALQCWWSRQFQCIAAFAHCQYVKGKDHAGFWKTGITTAWLRRFFRSKIQLCREMCERELYFIPFLALGLQPLLCHGCGWQSC